MRLLLLLLAMIIINIRIDAQVHVTPHVTRHITPHVTPHVIPHNNNSHSSGSFYNVPHGTSDYATTKVNSIYKNGNYEPVYVLKRNDIYTKKTTNGLVYYRLMYNKKTNKSDTIFSNTKEGLTEMVEYKSNDNPVKIATFVLFMFIVVGAVVYSLKN